MRSVCLGRLLQILIVAGSVDKQAAENVTCRGTNRTLTTFQCSDMTGGICTSAQAFDPLEGSNCFSLGKVCSCCGNSTAPCRGSGGSTGCICSKVGVPGWYEARCHGCDQGASVTVV
mmetsp:Transcript_101502/g.180368  ORF Transcript_101502/g.180368 Transcript_101502/m.180368 type:complete len:117 (-) Transcript_101502:70-420(-)